MRVRPKGKAKFNCLRAIISKALNDTKALTWSEDFQVYKAAEAQWDKLERIFKWLGTFE